VTAQSSADDLLTGFAAVDTSHVSDALDRLGLAGQCLGLRPLDRSFRLVGRAFTVRYVPVGVERGSVGDYIDDLGPGQVVVLDNAGRLDCTVWGDLLTATAHQRGVAGTVIDGVCRDSDRSLELGYPIYSRGTWMRTGKDRVRVDGYDGPVSIGGVRVEPGDVLVGDADGVVVIERDKAASLLEAAAKKVADERSRLADIAAGKNLLPKWLEESLRAAGLLKQGETL